MPSAPGTRKQLSLDPAGRHRLAPATEVAIPSVRAALDFAIFQAGTGAAAVDADDRISHNPATGALLFDADGNGTGAAIRFATLATGLAMTTAGFLVI